MRPIDEQGVVASGPAHDWHSVGVGEVFDQLQATEKGLRHEEAEARLARCGPNQLPEKPPPPLWLIFLRQFRSPLIYVLGVAAVVSLVIGEVKDAAFIAGVLVINAIIGSWQEWKAAKTSHALKKLLQVRASVLRDGEVHEIDARHVVPGDVVWLEPGARVPADMRLLTAHGLENDESLLTGESLPVLKDPTWLGEHKTPMADRVNMAFAGSTVDRGRGRGVVVATATDTAVGQLAVDVMAGTEGKPPLIVRMERFTNVIAVAVLFSAGVIGGLGVAFSGYHLSEMFLFAVALAVSAIPEGLPVAMTVALAVATTRMARRGVIVRRLTAVEGLGSCTYIGTDKTGTLTCNELTVQRIVLPDRQVYEVTGEGFVPDGSVRRDGAEVVVADHPELFAMARAGVLCNEADLHRRENDDWVWRGDAVDVALLALGHKLGLDRETALAAEPQINEIPFEPEHRYAATFHEVSGDLRVYVKGAPERVIAMCAMESGRAAALEAEAVSLAEQGYRVLALAEGDALGDLRGEDTPAEPRELRLLGLLGMIDPLRRGVVEAIASCASAGVTVSMITGDHRVTALAIARELGLVDDTHTRVVTGSELEDMDEACIRELVRDTRVFARVTPRQKLIIVEAAQACGHFVAVTGDGANDAAALKRSNVGVAMGRGGTDVAREAAELVIADDNFATIVGGIEEGRVAYDNIRKVTYLLISTGAAELVLMGLAITTGTPLPLLPVQLLWLNLVTNGIQDVALAFEPGEGDALRRKPRPPEEGLFDRLMIERTVVAAIVMGVVAFVTFTVLLPADPTDADIAHGRNCLLLLMVLFENIHIGNCRSETRSALVLSPLRSPILLAGAIAAFGVHVVSMYVPIGHELLGTAPLDLSQWVTMFLLALAIFPAMELHKLSWYLRSRSRA